LSEARCGESTLHGDAKSQERSTDHLMSDLGS